MMRELQAGNKSIAHQYKNAHIYIYIFNIYVPYIYIHLPIYIERCSDPHSLRSDLHDGSNIRNCLDQDGSKNKNLIEPHGMESNHSVQQNVTFIDEMPGDENRTSNIHDSLRSAPMLSDATLDDFFSRPVRIATYDWGVGVTLNDTILPWRNYFSDVKVSNRIANYKLLTADLCVKVVVNGNAFHYGRAMLSYTPFIGKDELTTNRSGVRADLVQLSQRPHVFIDPTTSQGACMLLPFTWWDNTIDITNGEDPNVDPDDNDWARMGQLELNSINVLKHANGATDGAKIGRAHV